MAAANDDIQRLRLELAARLSAGIRSGPVRPATTTVSVPLSRAEGLSRVSLFFFSTDLKDVPSEKYELILECAELADSLGLHAVWVPERHFNEFGAPYASPAVLLAAIAGRTQHLKLRAGSVVLPLHDPLLVAEQWGMLDAISHGRTGISLASGWHATDFVLNSDGFESRKQLLVEKLGILRKLWAGQTVERTRPDGTKVDVRTYPTPRSQPEVWLTASSNPATWDQAASLGLNVLTALLEQTLDEVEERAARYLQTVDNIGSDAADREITVMLHTHLASDADEARRRASGPLREYLSAHLNLYATQASGASAVTNAEEVSAADRDALVEHGLARYLNESGLFGSPESVSPIVHRLSKAGVTEIGCLVDFGLEREQVIECVHELGKLQKSLVGTFEGRAG